MKRRAKGDRSRPADSLDAVLERVAVAVHTAEAADTGEDNSTCSTEAVRKNSVGTAAVVAAAAVYCSTAAAVVAQAVKSRKEIAKRRAVAVDIADSANKAAAAAVCTCHRMQRA